MPDVRQHRRDKINWLFIGLVGASLIVHAGIFLKMSGLFESRQPSYLEIHVQKNAMPAPRKIPRPLSGAAPAPRPSVPEIQDSQSMPEAAAPKRLVQPSALAASAPAPPPAMPFVPDAAPDIVEWTPPVKGNDSASDSADHYLSGLRRRIEEKKSYPPAARQRRIAGRAVVEFVINADGAASGMKIIESARSSLLDQAALEAVRKASPFERPPADRFDLPLKLQIPITFEIIP